MAKSIKEKKESIQYIFFSLNLIFQANFNILKYIWYPNSLCLTISVSLVIFLLIYLHAENQNYPLIFSFYGGHSSPEKLRCPPFLTATPVRNYQSPQEQIQGGGEPIGLVPPNCECLQKKTQTEKKIKF